MKYKYQTRSNQWDITNNYLVLWRVNVTEMAKLKTTTIESFFENFGKPWKLEITYSKSN